MSKVAYQGEPGAYSERAVTVLFPSAQPLPCETIRLTFSRVTSGEADFGVVPVENSTDGAVNVTLDRLVHTELQICGELTLEVAQHLLSKATDLSEIKRVLSHP